MKSPWKHNQINDSFHNEISNIGEHDDIHKNSSIILDKN